jgi:N6-adenosine-specific RNA methylase IME4
MRGLPRKRFRVILADPPWKFRTWSKRGLKRSPDRHYRTMTLKQIKALPIAELAAKDAVLLLWATWPHLQQALEVIEAWGFTYKTCAFVYIKQTARGGLHWGTGYWTRANSEPCLLATRGHPKRKHADVHQVILAPRREHSRKPADVYERTERLLRGPYLELFARERRPRWRAWGNELGKFGGTSQNHSSERGDGQMLELGKRYVQKLR